MSALFENKVVLVTGSGQGVGRAVALAFGTEGAKVVTNNRKPGSTGRVSLTDEVYETLSPERRKEYDDINASISGDAESTAQKIIGAGGAALPVYADISKPEDAERLVRTAVDAYGTIDIVVNVAGAFGDSPLTEMSMELWDKVNNIKPRGYFSVMKYAIPYMQKKGWGRIINCSSKANLGDVFSKFAEYCTANAGVMGLTRAAACEFYSEGITVNAFAPWARTRASYDGEFLHWDEIQSMGVDFAITADTTPTPESLCPFLLYLCTDDAADITGSLFTVYGNTVQLHQQPIIMNTIAKAGNEFWTVDELRAEVPRNLLVDYKNILAYQ
ncbi:MAG: SDR family oxidoreductase [Coriobacteriales bacterium]|jgi:3-oxoacyl-[acyl-carrier protein] reductase|nr:SDR family oxidoreductase [Coriobacteriales bacterium]